MGKQFDERTIGDVPGASPPVDTVLPPTPKDYVVETPVGGSTPSQGNKANTAGTFSFLYDNSIKEPILDIKDTKNDISVTKLSNYNNYYYRTGTNYSAVAVPVSGISTAVDRYVRNQNNSGSSWYDNAHMAIRKLKPGTVLANCVGWANGRLLEIWNRAIQMKVIYEKNGTFYLSQNNTPIKGKVTRYNVPNCNASQFYDYWPTEEGWSKSSTPQVGSLIVWSTNGGYGSDGRQPGHIAVVEKILNAGEPNEKIIISESSAGKDGTKWIVRLSSNTSYTLSKSNNWYWFQGHTFRGFLHSPVCQLANTNAANQLFGLIDEVISESPSPEVMEAYEEAIERLKGIPVEQTYKVGDKVKITWLGYKTPQGGTKPRDRVNNIGVIASINSVNKNNPYPYEVKLNNNFLGYYKWDDIKKIV